jgi:hypothetical protein
VYEHREERLMFRAKALNREDLALFENLTSLYELCVLRKYPMTMFQARALCERAFKLFESITVTLCLNYADRSHRRTSQDTEDIGGSSQDTEDRHQTS